jgi:branched-chain amino acid transport system permease protein
MQTEQTLCFPGRRRRLLVLPLLLQTAGNAWVRIADMALLYVLLALGLNIVVGYAGLLDLGYVAFFAIGAYMYGLLASPHLTDSFPGLRADVPQRAAYAAVDRDHPAGAGLAGCSACCWARPRSSCAATTWPS